MSPLPPPPIRTPTVSHEFDPREGFFRRRRWIAVGSAAFAAVASVGGYMRFRDKSSQPAPHVAAHIVIETPTPDEIKLTQPGQIETILADGTAVKTGDVVVWLY